MNLNTTLSRHDYAIGDIFAGKQKKVSKEKTGKKNGHHHHLSVLLNKKGHNADACDGKSAGNVPVFFFAPLSRCVRGDFGIVRVKSVIPIQYR